jgi:hypothetical protein
MKQRLRCGCTLAMQAGDDFCSTPFPCCMPGGSTAHCLASAVTLLLELVYRWRHPPQTQQLHCAQACSTPKQSPRPRSSVSWQQQAPLHHHHHVTNQAISTPPSRKQLKGPSRQQLVTRKQFLKRRRLTAGAAGSQQRYRSRWQPAMWMTTMMTTIR